MTTTVHFTPTLTINMGAAKLTHAQFQEMCETNRDLRLELSSLGELTISEWCSFGLVDRSSKSTSGNLSTRSRTRNSPIPHTAQWRRYITWIHPRFNQHLVDI